MPRPPTASQARQTMDKAFKDLETTVTPQDAQEIEGSTLEDVRQAALAIETQLALRQSLRNMRRLTPLFKGMDYYKESMGVLCNGTPFLPWVWAPVTLILRIALDYVEAFEQIMNGYSRIATSLKRFEKLGKAFSGDAIIHETLAAFYKDILQFHKYAYKFVRRNSWNLLFLTSWGRFQRRFNILLDDMEKHGALIDQVVQTHHVIAARQMHQDIRQWREQSSHYLRRKETEESEDHYQAIISWLKANELDQIAIFDAITADSNLYAGTCKWIENSPKVSPWLDKDNLDTSFLWLQGIAGSGKTFISAHIIKSLQASTDTVLRHFCSSSYISSTTYEQILRSLILQLARMDGDLIAHVYSSYVQGKKSPTLSNLEKLFQNLVSAASNDPLHKAYVWVVLDGLDECQPERQARAISLMRLIAQRSISTGNTTFKVLISSRSMPLTSTRLWNTQTISLSDEKGHIESDIQYYASQRLQSLYRRYPELGLTQEEIAEIEIAIAKKADGMFLYARLVLDYLGVNIFYTGNEIKDSLDQLPGQLADFYREILTRILIQLNPLSVNRIKCVLGWIAFQKRPLKKLELLSAVTFSQGKPNATHLAPAFVLEACGSLIEERRDSTVTFIHSSVKEFLQTPSSNLIIDERQVLEEHAISVMTCLLSGLGISGHSEFDRHLRVVKALHGLQVYASEYWTDYLLSQANSPNGLDPNSKLFALVNQLVHALDGQDSNDVEMSDEQDLEESDARLSCLSRYPILLKHVKRSLGAKSPEALKQLVGLSSEHGIHLQEGNLAQDGISAALALHQDSVRHLLSQRDFPGVSAEQLKAFKSQFEMLAFTCRLKSCPRTTLGFASEKLLIEHELSHIPRFVCTVTGCRYPPFVSGQALRSHNNKYHVQNPVLRLRRRAGTENVLHQPSSSRNDDFWGAASLGGGGELTSSVGQIPSGMPVREPFDTEYLELRVEVFSNLSSINFLGVEGSHAPVPDAESLNETIVHLQRLQATTDRRGYFFGRAARILHFAQL